MSQLALLIMAAGMGSRYGGLKQLDEIGPNGETIIDYSVYDAIQSGFNKIIFVVRDEFKEDFKIKISNKYLDKIEIHHVSQTLSNIPIINKLSNERRKPWGTGHAILSAKSIIDCPFVVINGDDFYGRKSFKIICNYYKNNKHFSMVSFRLDNTLSINGPVTRGICKVDNGQLLNVTETDGLIRENSKIISNRNIDLNGDEHVSMNMWGFTTKIFDYLNEGFVDFLNNNNNNINSEYLIPTVINEIIDSQKEKLYVLQTNENWFGVTYKDDKSYVKEKIEKLIEKGLYPKLINNKNI